MYRLVWYSACELHTVYCSAASWSAYLCCECTVAVCASSRTHAASCAVLQVPVSALVDLTSQQHAQQLHAARETEVLACVLGNAAPSLLWWRPNAEPNQFTVHACTDARMRAIRARQQAVSMQSSAGSQHRPFSPNQGNFTLVPEACYPACSAGRAGKC
jgi:hypothetical protein